MPTARPMCAHRVEAAGLKLSLLEDRSARNEDNVPVPGLVAVATRKLEVLDATISALAELIPASRAALRREGDSSLLPRPPGM